MSPAPIGNGQALGQPLDAQALLEVIYGSSPIVTGQAYAADAVAERPNCEFGQEAVALVLATLLT